MESPQNVLDAVLQFAQTLRKLREEFLSLARGGVTNTAKGFLEEHNKHEGPEEYTERLKRLEEIWAPDGPMTQCSQRMDNVLAILDRAIKDNTQPESDKKPLGRLEGLAAVVDQLTKELSEEEGKKEKREGNEGPNDAPKPEELSRNASTQEAPVGDFLAFFFCDFRDVLEELDLAVTFPDLVQRHSDGLLPPAGIESLQELLLCAMRLHDRKIIVIDGLDECDDVPTVLGCLEKVLAEKNVRLLVTSRPEEVIRAQYDCRPTINLEEYLEYVNNDIRESLMKQMTDHYRLQAIPPPTKQELVDSVTKQAEGSLHACRSVGQVHTIIRDLPKDLDAVYENILHEVLSQVREAVKIELGHTAPIHLNDNLTIVSEEDMMYVCGNLVKLDNYTRVLGFGHPTVRAYLTKPPLDDEHFRRYFVDTHDSDRDLALRSITYILAEDIDKTIVESYKPTYLFESSRRHYIINHCPMISYVFDGGFEHIQYITQER
ncbi:hypothetical protein BS17DRAFT_879644 [Gyrodon lividus]|nr:hypothetical protein BS17DRAFT_879644 [Gyrodon lividus]